MKSFAILARACLASINLLAICNAGAQSDAEQVIVEPAVALSSVSSGPAQTEPPPPPDQTVTVVFTDGASLTTLAVQGTTALVGIGATETVLVQVRFPGANAGEPVLAQSLDGGSVSAHESATTVDAEGRITLNFAAGDKPGLYRLSAKVGTATSIIQFWVSDPDNPSGNPPVLTPETGGE